MGKWLACKVSVRRVRWEWAALSLALGACVASPRATSDISSRTEAVAFSGLFEAPEVDLELQAKNQRTNNWVRFATTRTRSQDPVIGVSGSPYFRFALNAALPQSADYWIPHKGQGRIEAQVRVAYGDRVLATFSSDAETCGRQAQAASLTEQQAVARCSTTDDAFARVFAAACGGLGEPCCPGAGAAASCAAAYVCSEQVCRAPGYPVPLLADYQVDLPIPTGYLLRDAWLVLDDRANGPDSERRLLENYRAESGVKREFPHPNVVRLRFDFGFWKPGVNRFMLRGIAANGDRRRVVETPLQQLDYVVPRQLGLAADGRFQLPHEQFPRLMRDCRGPFCKDADGDGQNDLWENMLVEQLRPRLMFDSGDGLFRGNTDTVRTLTSVVPIEREGESYVVVVSVLAFSRDYGFLGSFSHPGDTESFGMMFKVDAADGLTWVASASKGHPCLTCKSRYAWSAQDFAQDGTPLVYVERDKHGLWSQARRCRELSAFRCRGDRNLRPSAINIGDYSADGSRGLIDGLDGLSPNGPFGVLAGVFPGDAIWTAARSRVSGRFCGGKTGCTQSNSAPQPGGVIAHLLALFAEQVFDVHGQPRAPLAAERHAFE
jgi:hypothetical protein